MASRKINREELAWAAGFFDGEGGTYVQPQSSRKDGTKRVIIRVSISQKDKRALTRFHKAIFNIGFITFANRTQVYKGKVFKRPLYDLRTGTCSQAQAIIALLWTWLGPVKREQYIKNFKKMQKHNSKNPLKRTPIYG